MGSSDIEYLVTDEAIHVGCDLDGHWWAVGRSYGSHPSGTGYGLYGSPSSFGYANTQAEAIRIAKDASATGWHGCRRIIVHTFNGCIKAIITRVRQRPSPQFYQDSVP